MNISRKIFYLIAFLLPLNLGKHFILSESYVKGLLVDYLIPTIYVQDILIVILLLVWFYEIAKFRGFNKAYLKQIFFPKELIFVYYLIFSLFLSSLVAPSLFISISGFLRLFLYFLLFLYMYSNFSFEDRSHTFIGVVSSSFFLVSVLGILQFIKQGSVFNNYLFFGEQPYTLSTPGITLESVLGFTVVPSYGLFRHPNVFGGLLSILIIWVISKLKYSRLYMVYLVFMFMALLLTFSWFSCLSLLLGLFVYFFLKDTYRIYLPLIILVFFLVSLLFPPLSSYLNISFDDTSVLRRSNLLVSSFNMSEDYPLYGVGYSSFTKFIEAYLSYMSSVRFLQPVHNVFILILTESGLITFSLFVYIIFNLLVKMNNVLENKWLLVSLIQFVFLASFDHYFWTIHQPLLFLWLLLGMCWTSLKNY